MEARQAAEARQRVTALYRAHALGLVKLAVLMVGDQLTAEDVVQDAFLGLYRRWAALQNQDKALSKLAVEVGSGHNGQPGLLEIRIYTLATGAFRARRLLQRVSGCMCRSGTGTRTPVTLTGR